MRKNIKILLLLLVSGLALSWPMYTILSSMEKSDEQQQFSRVDKLAEELLALTKKGDMEQARIKIQNLADIFPSQTLPVSIKIESLNAVTQSILAARNVFSAGKADDDKLLWHATQVRVAIDALTHPNQAMWRNYYTSFTSQMQNLLQASVERDAEELRDQFAENYRLFLAIKPAMSVQLPEPEMEKINASYDALIKQVRNETVDWQVVRETLRDLNASISAAFLGDDRHAISDWLDTRSLVMLSASIGTLVSITLAYVAWRKYYAAGV
ncbi:sporulation protein YpjB [Brevibacillus fluminis]|uniref:sporulation protein YpjB n=1 Tax=Brevibacillus fluminis TaxID=511487 RepID=UPI003F8A1E5E